MVFRLDTTQFVCPEHTPQLYNSQNQADYAGPGPPRGGPNDEPPRGRPDPDPRATGFALGPPSFDGRPTPHGGRNSPKSRAEENSTMFAKIETSLERLFAKLLGSEPAAPQEKSNEVVRGMP